MSGNGDRIRELAEELEPGEVVTYGYIADRLNREGPAKPTSPRGVGRAIWKGASTDGFPWWRVVDGRFRPLDGARERLEGEGWKFLGNAIHPDMRHRVRRDGCCPFRHSGD